MCVCSLCEKQEIEREIDTTTPTRVEDRRQTNTQKEKGREIIKGLAFIFHAVVENWFLSFVFCFTISH